MESYRVFVCVCVWVCVCLTYFEPIGGYVCVCACQTEKHRRIDERVPKVLVVFGGGFGYVVQPLLGMVEPTEPFV